MDAKLKTLNLIIIALAGNLATQAQGYIVPNGVTYLGLSDLGGYETHVIQNPTTGDYTGFLLKQRSQTSFAFDPFVDEGVRTFIVSANDPVSLQPIMAGSYTELTYPNNYDFANGSTFYLGFYTGYNPWDSHGNYTGIYTNPVFGWGRFRNNDGVIEMLSSGLEYGGGGILAGTLTIIPEPSSLALFSLGALFFGVRRFKR